jgi:hypothetical protein
MKLYHLRDEVVNYSSLTINKGCEGLAKLLDVGYVILSRDQYKALDFSVEDDSVFIFEAAVLRGMETTHTAIKGLANNVKTVCLSGDAIYFERTKNYGGYEISEPEKVDLFLDLMDEIVDIYRGRGINADSWMWTTSQYLVDEFTKRAGEIATTKTHDFIGLWKTCWGDDEQRRYLLEHLDKSNRSIIKSGEVSYELGDIYGKYASSWFCLGTTSPSWTAHVRTMKGFRDWIAPLCGTVLIYDNHPDVVRKFTCVPLYEYGNHQAVIDLADKIRGDGSYHDILVKQREWVVNNTIEKQLLRRLQEHKLV